MEHVALVAVVAAVLAVVGLWLAGHVRAPERPPPLVERIVSRPPASIPDIGIAPRPGRPGLLRRVAGAVRTGAGVVGAGAAAFAGGVAAGTAQLATQALRDPVGTVVGGGEILRAVMADPVGAGRAGVAAARDYAAELRSMTPREAYERIMHDLGEASVDVVVLRGRQIVRKVVLRAIRRRYGAGGPPRR